MSAYALNRGLVRPALILAASCAALSLAGCGKPSAVAGAGSPPAPGQSSASGASSYAGSYSGASRAPDPRDAPVPKVNGKPMWAANRKHTAEENAQYQFAKNGADFSAKSESEYVADAHAFVDKPPKDVEVIERRNGDRLMYDPKGNIFAVVARTGAPRTLFKPRDGESYWSQTKAREAERDKTRQESSTDQS